MKKLIFLFILFISVAIKAQDNTDIKQVDIKDINGQSFNTSLIANDGKPFIIDFWATWCKPCIKELMAISDVYEDWQAETGVKIYAVSIDDSRTMSKVKSFVDSKAWDFTVLLDPNGDFKRAMNVVNVPHTFLFDGSGKLVAQHTSYAEGDEIELFEKVKKIVRDTTE